MFRQSPTRPYVEWPHFSAQTSSIKLRACMMDLHWYVNNANWKLAFREIARFAFYVFRLLRSPKQAAGNHCNVLFVLDAPGVGGLLTFLPLLQIKPSGVRITIAVTEFIGRNTQFVSAIAASEDVSVVNMDRVRGALRLDRSLIGSTFAMLRHFPRLIGTMPLFLCRHHAYSAVARNCMHDSPPDVVVLFNERMLPSACFSEVARDQGVATVAIQHGNFVDNYLPVMVEHYLTWGRFHSAWLHDRSSCKTEAIGSPRMDRALPTQQRRPELRSDRTLHLVFFSQVGSATVSPAMISATRQQILLLSDDPTFKVTIKLHPLDSRENWQNEGPRSANVGYLDGKTSLAQALGEADLVCSFYSTILAEALLWEIPVVQLNPFPELVSGFPDRDGIAWVQDIDALRALVARWQASAAALESLLAKQHTLREGYFSHLGSASRRFWDALPLARRASATSSTTITNPYP